MTDFKLYCHVLFLALPSSVETQGEVVKFVTPV